MSVIAGTASGGMNAGSDFGFIAIFLPLSFIMLIAEITVSGKFICKNKITGEFHDKN